MVSQHSLSAVPCGGGIAGPRRDTNATRRESIAQYWDILECEFTALLIAEESVPVR
jgi:hypothetical protein